MTFRESLDEDLDAVFFLEEFAEPHQINESDVICIVYDCHMEGISKTLESMLDSGQGLYEAEKIVQVRQNELDFCPFEGQSIQLDHEHYRVQSCVTSPGIYQIALGNYQD